MRFGHSLIAGVIKSFNIFGSEASWALLFTGFFLLFRPKNDLMSDYIVNPIKKFLVLDFPKGLAPYHF